MKNFSIVTAEFPKDIPLIQTLFQEYQQEIKADLCFQSFQEELDNLPGKYAEVRGTILLAYVKEKPAGIIALRPMDSKGYCEMKRLYVREKYKAMGLGKNLVLEVLDRARDKNYQCMRLDTLERLIPAVKLYESLGFRRIEGYYENPLEGVVFMEKRISQQAV